MSDLPNRPVAFLRPDEILVERIFPIRNLVGEQSSESSEKTSGRLISASDKPRPDEKKAGQENAAQETTLLQNADHSDSSDDSSYLSPPWPSVPSEESLRKLSLPDSPVQNQGEEDRRITERSQLVPTKTGPLGSAPGLLIHDGQPKFYHCEDEPIHTPGAIQQYGALVAARYDDNDNLQVRYVSENTQLLLKFTPEQLFGLESFLDIMEEKSREDLVARITNALNCTNSQTEDTHLDVFTMILNCPDHSQMGVWCAMHIAHGSSDLVICEFEELSEIFHLDNLRGNNLPKSPTQTLDHDVADEERSKSTTSGSEPLRVLQIARRRQQKEVSPMDIFNAMTQAQEQLSETKDIQSILDTVVGLISELTGYHRTMFYRFDANKNGCVDAELVDPRASSDVFRGLHYPASDIPQQARDLYKINRIRALYDRDAETARLVCRDLSDFERKLDLTHSYLRAMSPIHLKYLMNMEVRSTICISIVIDDDLWGLIVGHGYGDKGIRVTPPIRELCRNIGECASTNIQRLLMLQRIQARKTPPRAPSVQSPSGFIAASSTDLLRVFQADFGLLSIQDEARAIGRLDPYREALALLAHLQANTHTGILSSQNINKDCPDVNYPPGIHTIAGLLLIPLSLRGNDFLVFFRKGELNEVRWAGNPYEKVSKAGLHYLEPRSSFKRWTETIVGVSKAWTEDQLETADVLSLLYGRFIEIWRQKESASQNNRMTRLLIRNSAHEVRTPLNAIVNYLEMALESKIDEPTQEILAKAHKASKSLIYVIDDLLNLTKAESGRIPIPNESFNLGGTVSEVITAFRKEANRKGLDLTVSTHQGIPEMVKGDPSRLRQVLSNIISNAFQHSVAGGIRVDISPIRLDASQAVVAITVQDIGVGMSESQLDDLFQNFEQILDEEHPPPSPSLTSSPAGTPSSQDSHQLGLGLAVVARYVRNMNGQIRVRSELGKGTIFGIELPFEVAPTSAVGVQGRLPLSVSSNTQDVKLPRSLSSSSVLRNAGDRKHSFAFSSSSSAQSESMDLQSRASIATAPSMPLSSLSTARSVDDVPAKLMNDQMEEESRHSENEVSSNRYLSNQARYHSSIIDEVLQATKQLKDASITTSGSTDSIDKLAVYLQGLPQHIVSPELQSNSSIDVRLHEVESGRSTDSRVATTINELGELLVMNDRGRQDTPRNVSPSVPLTEGRASPVDGIRRHGLQPPSFQPGQLDFSAVESAFLNERLLPVGTPDSGIPATPSSESRGDSHSVRSTPLSLTQGTTFPFPQQQDEPKREPLNVLIAEDNPINVKLLTKRLQKFGYGVEVAPNGQDCHDQFVAHPLDVDVILMDLQMPLVDGEQSTKMIRLFEQTGPEELKRARTRVPIIAVSASLTEENRFNYVQCGFDGWILKPIDVNRLDYLMQGIRRPEWKIEAMYSPGSWGAGGWFIL